MYVSPSAVDHKADTDHEMQDPEGAADRVPDLFNALDKGNLGNAKTAGLTEDLGFKGNQYNIIVSIFFVPYVLAAPPVAMLGKKYGPHRALPVMMFGFGAMTLLMAAAQNFSGVMALRFFLGISEAAFFPLVIYYLTTFYRRGELARRLALFYAASNIANAFVSSRPWGPFFATFTISASSHLGSRPLFFVKQKKKKKKVHV